MITGEFTGIYFNHLSAIKKSDLATLSDRPRKTQHFDTDFKVLGFHQGEVDIENHAVLFDIDGNPASSGEKSGTSTYRQRAGRRFDVHGF